MKPVPPERETLLPATRWVAVLLLPALVTAGLILSGWPDRTAQLFAWTIQPRMTPLLMGASYLAGAYFFLQVARAKRWETVRLGFLPVSAFAWLAGVATVLHWDRFNHSHPTFFAWVFLYAASPLIIPALWLANRRLNRGTQAVSGPGIPVVFSAVILLAGLSLLVTGAALFLSPQTMIPLWAWNLTPLTARIVGSFYVLTGLVDLSVGLHRRWDTVRVVVETQLIALALLLIGVLRAQEVLDWQNLNSYLFAGGIGLLLVALGSLYFWMARRSEQLDSEAAR